jgi:hypothetical protein
MSRRAFRNGLVALLFLARPAAAAPVPGTCRVTEMVNRVLAPVDLPFPISTATGLSVAVTIDPETGAFTLDGGSIVVPPYPMNFSEARDVFDLADETFSGTIDNRGAVVLPGVRFTICTLGTPAGTDCVPSNLCSNDVSRICIRGAGGGAGCAEGGVCQGVCGGNRSRTCASDADCGVGDRCGTGTLVRFSMDLTTGRSTFGTNAVDGSPLDFESGELTLAFVTNTPRESPIVQDTGITSLFLSCVLDPAPDPRRLPAPAGFSVSRGYVRLGPEGSSAAADTLNLTGLFTPLGVVDFDAEDLVITLGPPGVTLLTLRIPAGSMTPNRKGNRFTLRDGAGVVQVTPSVPGAPPASHVITVKRGRGTRHRVTVVSRGLNLDPLVSAAQGGGGIETSATLGFQSVSTMNRGVARRRGVRF